MGAVRTALFVSKVNVTMLNQGFTIISIAIMILAVVCICRQTLLAWRGLAP